MAGSTPHVVVRQIHADFVSSRVAQTEFRAEDRIATVRLLDSSLSVSMRCFLGTLHEYVPSKGVSNVHSRKRRLLPLVLEIRPHSNRGIPPRWFSPGRVKEQMCIVSVWWLQSRMASVLSLCINRHRVGSTVTNFRSPRLPWMGISREGAVFVFVFVFVEAKEEDVRGWFFGSRNQYSLEELALSDESVLEGGV